MKTKAEIVNNWLPRYTDTALEDFGKYILLVNFDTYLQMFADWFHVPVRGEGTSNDYFPPEVPALPAFNLQKAVSTKIRNHDRDYWTGTDYTTNRRVCEHDEDFKIYLVRIRVMAVDMETATLFSTGFFNKIPTGALLLVSDQPMTPSGIKTAESAISSNRPCKIREVADIARG